MHDMRCAECGRFVAYADIPDRVNFLFTPETEFGHERHEYAHKQCPIPTLIFMIGTVDIHRKLLYPVSL